MRKLTKLTLILVLMLFLSSFAVNAATTGLSGLLVTNVNALDFKVNIDATNAVTNIVKMNLSRSQFQAPVVPGDVWTLTNISGVYGGSTNIITNSIWGIDGSGHITPVVTNSAVIATNIVRDGHGVNTGSETWQTKSIVLTNGVNYLPVSDWSQLQLISPSSDPSLVQIVLSNGWNTVQHLEIFNLTNAVPSQGAFTLTNLTPIPDSLGGGAVKLINNENWVATNGCGIELRFISPDWVEQFRSDVSGNPTFISNTFNNITVISNTTLRGRITINNINVTTNDLWKTNFTGTSTNLLPVDPSLYVLAPNGYLAGANTAVAVNNALASTRDSNLGELDANGISIISRNSLANTEAAFSIGGAILGGYSEALYSKDTTTRWEIGRSVDSTVGADFYIGTNGIGGLVKYIDLSPNAADGTAIVKLGTAVTHTTGNIFELANNTTNRVVVTPLSTLIGSPVTSPNFSVPAALQVSNFQDRGKALTVDIKLGASGNNDDYPVYFYSQITNSSAHPTINMEEVSPSGYIGGAHTLLSVQETPKVTNTVSTWPTYAAASTTAGYFNAAPTGGTNGAAMGLQGSVDPTRNFINIGVGSYVEATTDNLAATNIAFSGTVNQVLGTQKAVGGLFEIGSLANIPAIPSSAGVLIDGHNSGAPLIIAQTNGAVQFKVAANSGYAGAGTTFLADDGTYKSAGGPGGSTLWYENTSGSSSGVYYLSNSLSGVTLNNTTNLVAAGVAGNGFTDLGKSSGIMLLSVSAGTNMIATNSSNIFLAGFEAGRGVKITNSTRITGIADGTFVNAGMSNSYDVIAFGDNALATAQINDSGEITAFCDDSMFAATITNSFDILGVGNTSLEGALVKGSHDVTAIAYNAMHNAQMNNVSYNVAIGDGAMDSAKLDNCQDVVAIANGAFGSAKITNSFDLNAFGQSALYGATVLGSHDITAIADSSLYNSILDTCSAIAAFNGALQSAHLTNSVKVTGIGDGAGASVAGTFSNVLFLGSGATATDGTTNRVIAGTGMVIEAPGGFSSLATNTGAISSTGWTNSLGKDADVAFDATTLVYKLADNAGTFWYTNTVAVGQGFIHLQPGGKFVLVSGTGLTGQYHSH